jgi:monosaccharide-transporting ATPase
MQDSAALLQLEQLSKRFVGVQALNKVDFELASGEVHALLGENGAGKSTLVKLMTGAHAADAGEMRLHGEPIRPASPAAALELGISCVYQEVNLLPNLTVAHNLFLGREPKRHGLIDWKRIHAEAGQVLARFGLDLDVKRSLASCSLAVQQLVAIARGVELSAQVLVLDEPTASLDASEVALLFRILEDLKAAGTGIVFVTHFLDQVYAISDRITVLRNGERVGTFEASSLPRSALIAHMLGKELQSVELGGARQAKPRALSAVIEARAVAADNGLERVSFEAHAGEAMGLAGLLGSGRTEVCELLAGLAKLTAGRLSLRGSTERIDSPARAVARGVALCPEDRKSAGLIGLLSVRENIALGLQARRGWWRRLAVAEQLRLTRVAIDQLGIVCRNAEVSAETLSGGNQQKLILARWLSIEPQVLVLDEPTRGIDIGAHAEIIKLVRQLRDQGLTVIIASSELEELVAFCDKVLVLRAGTSVAELSGAAITEPALVAAIAHSA